MAEQLNKLKPALMQGVLTALQRQALSNRGNLPLFRLPALSRELTEMLLSRTGQSRQGAYDYGLSLGKLGLSLTSTIEAMTAVAEIVMRADASEQSGMPFAAMMGFFGQAIQGLVAGEADDLERQRADMERVYLATMAQQQEQQDQLRSTIRELSTPIMPIHEGILVLPLVGSIDSRRALEIAENLLRRSLPSRPRSSSSISPACRSSTPAPPTTC